jgi:dihydrofolate reductase
MAHTGALLLGRRTYRTMTEPLTWQNSTLLHGDAAEAVAALKSESGPDIAILGSGELFQSLRRHNLIDEYVFTGTGVVIATYQAA